MRFLLDTNVVSELRKPADRADLQVVSWAGRQSPADLAISAVTVFEIEYGIARLHRRDAEQSRVLRSWLEDQVLQGFAGRVLVLDVSVARRAARLHVPDPMPERDGYIAATALEHGLTVVTRNVADFAASGVATLDPWR